MTQPHYIDRRLKTFPPETEGVQSQFVIVHQLRASADIQDNEITRTMGRKATTDRASLMREAADAIERLAAPMEAVSRTYCQKCGGDVEGWSCQSCDQEFREDDAGNLVFDDDEPSPAMEAVAWRWEDTMPGRAGKKVWRAVTDLDSLANLRDAGIEVQALAVIPTEGGEGRD